MRNRERAISLKQTVFQPRKRCGLDTAWMPWKHRMQSKEPDTGLPTAVPLARSQEAGGELPGLGGRGGVRQRCLCPEATLRTLSVGRVGLRACDVYFSRVL